jgi:DNA-binding transcriptional LysR family regulator
LSLPARLGRARPAQIDIDPFFLPLVLAGRLGAFCERYPELAIEFVTSEHVGDLVSEGIDLAIRFGQPRLSTLVSRKLIEAPILTWRRRAISSAMANPHPSDLARHRCLQFLDPYTGRPFDWEFIRGEETVEVPTSGPLTFTDPKSMLEECVAGTGVAQIIGWGVSKQSAGERRADRPVSGLARRALPAVRLPSIAQASAGQCASCSAVCTFG